MKTSSLKYMEWRDPQELHEDSLSCISELRFAKDELQFLSDLLKSYTLDLLSKESFEESRELASSISKLRNELKSLLKGIEKHSNLLESIIDDEEIPGEVEEYKDRHYKLMFEAANYLTRFKKLKRRVYRMIKPVLKRKKTKQLLRP